MFRSRVTDDDWTEGWHWLGPQPLMDMRMLWRPTVDRSSELRAERSHVTGSDWKGPKLDFVIEDAAPDEDLRA